ncbi:MAG: IclR family transcriptional regulator [Halarchaeum sp.]
MRNDDGAGGTVKSGARLLRIVRLLQEHGGLGVSEVADRLGKPRGSVHRYLKTLDEDGYVVNDDGRYRLSLRFLDHGVHVQRRHDLYEAATEKVDALAHAVDERAWCLVEERGWGVFLYGAVGANAVATDARVGAHVPLHSTSGGKAILASLAPERVDDIVDRRGLARRTDHTIADPDELRAELDEVRERGYALNLEESIDGLHAVGAPIVADGEVRGALSVSGAANRLSESRCRNEIADRVLTAANDVELDLTYG